MPWWIWVLAGFLLLAIEFVSTTMHLGLFAVGAFVVAILVGFGVDMPLWGQLLTFAGVSIAAFVFIRPMLVRQLKLNVTKNVDTLSGEQAIPLEDLAPGAQGRAELRGTTWSARNVGSEALTKGQRCVVDRVDGLMLLIRAS